MPSLSKIIGCALCIFAGTMTLTQGHSDVVSPAPNGIDHILYASSNLQQGMDEVEALLGVRPVIGGNHPQYGTHNALLSLGPGVYLEVIARDPDLKPPERGLLVDVPEDRGSHVLTWVLRSEDIERLADTAQRAGIALGPVDSGSRVRPDGTTLSWQLTDPYAMPMNGAIPFLIHWGNTPHPSLNLPSGGALVELVIEHPQANLVRDALSVLGANVTVVEGEAPRISARIETDYGLRTLE